MKKWLKVILSACVASLSLQVCTLQAGDTIRFATNASYAPFESINSHNDIVGFDIDIAKALCAQINATCTFQNQPFDSIIPALKYHRYDAGISCFDITKERSQQVLFSDVYYKNSAVFVTLKKNNIHNIAQLKGKRIGLQNGTTHQRYIHDKIPGMIPAPSNNYQTAFMDLQNGRSAAIFGDTAVVNEWFKTSGDQLALIGKPVHDPAYFGQGFGIIFNKNNTALQQKFNQALATIKANGQYDAIYQKYFSQ